MQMTLSCSMHLHPVSSCLCPSKGLRHTEEWRQLWAQLRPNRHNKKGKHDVSSSIGKCNNRNSWQTHFSNLLLKLAIGKFKEKVVPFETVPDAVARGNADAGLVIHEAQ